MDALLAAFVIWALRTLLVDAGVGFAGALYTTATTLFNAVSTMPKDSVNVLAALLVLCFVCTLVYSLCPSPYRAGVFPDGVQLILTPYQRCHPQRCPHLTFLIHDNILDSPPPPPPPYPDVEPDPVSEREAEKDAELAERERVALDNARNMRRTNANLQTRLKVAIQAILKAFKIQELKPFQLHALEHMNRRKDVMVIADTGSGKSVIFQSAPLLIPGSICLVISPLLSLVRDQVSTITKGKALTVKHLVTAADCQENAVVNGEFQLLYCAPEMLEIPEFHDLIDSALYQV